MKEASEKILDIKVNHKEAIKAIAEYQTKIDEAKDAEKELKEQLKAGEIGREQYNKSMAASKLAINDYRDSIRVLSKQIKNELKAEKEQEDSLNSLRAKLSNLTAEYDAMSKAEREGAEGLALKDSINELTSALKGAEEETQRFYRNVGNYKNSILEAAQANVPFVDKINQMVTGVKGAKDYFKATSAEMRTVITTATGLTRVLKILKVALISTGIGALVVALGSLISYLGKTQKGVELASKVMSGLGAAVDVIIDRMSKLGSALVNLFTFNLKAAAEDAKAAISGVGREIIEETKMAVALSKALTDIEKREVMLSMSRAANRAEIEKLKKAADDTTLATEERIKAAEKAAQMEKEDLKAQTALAEARLANTLGFTEMNNEVKALMEQIKAGEVTADEVIGKLGLSESTLEDLKAFRDQFNELQDVMETSYGRQTEQQNTLNSIRKEGAEAAKAAAEKRIQLKQKELAEIRKAEDEMIKLISDERMRKSAQIETDFNRQIEDLKNRLKTEKDLTVSAREAINEQIVAIEQQKNVELQKLSDETLKEEISRKEEEYKKLIEADEKANSEMMEKIRIRYQTEVELARGNEDEILRIRMEEKQAELDAIHQLEGESQEAFNLRKLEIESEYLDAKEELQRREIEMEEDKVAAIAGLAGSLSAMLEQAGEDNKAAAQLAKVLAIAEVAIAQGVAIAKAVKTATSSSATWVDMLAAISTVVASVTAVMGTAMKSVKSAKFAKGGLVSGPGTESSDSIPAQLSNGESVMTARATSMFAPILSSFNQMGGGVPINVTQTSNQTLGEDMLARAVAKGVKDLHPVVSVEEINQVMNRVKVLEQVSKL